MSSNICPFAQFYLLSPRGDSIIYRNFRGDVRNSTAEIFFRNVKFFGGKQQDAPPVFNLEGLNYIYLKKNGLFFVVVTVDNVSPMYTMELLIRLTKLFKDYCGILSEESIRTNFVLIYELLDEIMDFGYVQGTSTELLKAYVFNEPIVVDEKKVGFKIPDLNPKTTPSTAVDKPITFQEKKGKKRKNEIFVDIYEKISITFNPSGAVLNSSIDGTIQMKSYLAGNPHLKLALNEELVVGKGASRGSYGAVEIADCNFHECVNTEGFEDQRILSFLPPDGEFTVMNYRITSDFRAPFRVFPFFELVSPHKIELIIKIRADIPEHNYGGNVSVVFPVPKATSTVTNELGVGVVGQAAEYDQKERKVIWKIKKFTGGTEQTIRTKITLEAAHTTAVRKEVGPISMNFEIPMFNPSGLQVRYLRILEKESYNPYRWVRYVTRSSSYVCRI